ncbi:replication-relaxation family protein [Sphingobium sp. AN641]|uniref:replication-relaxation family protein n=1 Tax=Sphingobium sp. AN641 TaxID=3133443 RepID=UPI0030C045A5
MANVAHLRRIRSAPPSARVQRLVLSDADYELFQAINRHGPLPSNYLYEFTRRRRRDRSHLQNRLTEFYNGDAGGSYLTRPRQQFASYQARYQPLIYDLAPRALRALSERGTLASPAAVRSDPFVHRFMTACVSASLELTAPSQGLRYISFQEILDHPKCGAARTAANPLALQLGNRLAGEIIPDLLYGIEYPGIGFRFFAVEIDRNTESIERRNLCQSAFARKVAGYVAALRDQSYRLWWGIPNLHILTVTTNATHARKLNEYIKSHVPETVQSRFVIKVDATFGIDWRVPDAPLIQMLPIRAL